VRGAVSGLGLVNLAVGFTDLSRVFAAREGAAMPDGHSDPT